MYVYRRPTDYAQRARGAQTNFAATFTGITQRVNGNLGSGTFSAFSALITYDAPTASRSSRTMRTAASAVYRRPWDYAARRDKIGRVQRLTTIGAASQTLTFTTYGASITSTAITDPRGSRAVRPPQSYVFRKPWQYAQIQARVDIHYTFVLVGPIEAQTTSAQWLTFPATVVGNQNAIRANLASGTFATYDATVDKAVANIQATRALGTFSTFDAAITSSFGGATFVNARFTSATFNTFPFDIRFGIFTSRANGTFTGHTATLVSSRQVDFARAVAAFDTRPATITSQFGLGLSRTGDVSAKSTGPYTRGTTRATVRKGRTRSVTNEWTKRK